MASSSFSRANSIDKFSKNASGVSFQESIEKSTFQSYENKFRTISKGFLKGDTSWFRISR